MSEILVSTLLSKCQVDCTLFKLKVSYFVSSCESLELNKLKAD